MQEQRRCAASDRCELSRTCKAAGKRKLRQRQTPDTAHAPTQGGSRIIRTPSPEPVRHPAKDFLGTLERSLLRLWR
jgi:hypothetical protein